MKTDTTGVNEMVYQKRWMILFLTVLIFAATGCDSETDSSTTDKKEPSKSDATKLIEPCKLITQAEAEEIMGVMFKAG